MKARCSTITYCIANSGSIICNSERTLACPHVTRKHKSQKRNNWHTVAPILIRKFLNTDEQLSVPSVDQTSTNATHRFRVVVWGRSRNLTGDDSTDEGVIGEHEVDEHELKQKI